MQTTEQIKPPTAPAELTIKQLHEVLTRPIPPNQIKVKPGKAKANYITWNFAQSVINKYCLGYQWRVKSVSQISDRAVVIGELIVPCKDGNVTVESCGSSELQEFHKRNHQADPICTAEQQAFKRCCKRLGLALHLED
jgi:hypothetical protein